MMGRVLDASIAISLLKRFYSWCSHRQQRLSDIYGNSQTYRLSKLFWEKLKISSRFSFLGKVSEIRQTSSTVLDNSRAMHYLVSMYKRWKHKLSNYSGGSSTAILAKDIKHSLNASPVRILSIIVCTAVVVNVCLSLVLAKPIDLWGWLMRGLFFFAGLAGLFCAVDRAILEKTSILLRKTKRSDGKN